MCLTSTTVRPRLSEKLGVSILCTGHTVCVLHPLVIPRLSEQLGVSLLCTDHTVFIRTTWCLTSTTVRPRLSEQLGVSLLCTGHTVCVSHPLHSDLVYPNNLVSLYSVLAILYVSLTSVLTTTLRPRLSEQLGVSLLCTGHTVCVSHLLHSDLVYPNNLVSLYSVLTILYVSHIHYSQTSFIRTTWCLSIYCMCLCTGHTVCVSHPLQSDLVNPNNLVSLYSVLTILYASHIHYTQTSFIRTTWCLSTLY